MCTCKYINSVMGNRCEILKLMLVIKIGIKESGFVLVSYQRKWHDLENWAKVSILSCEFAVTKHSNIVEKHQSIYVFLT